MDTGGVSVLVVCHANLCRSPMGERLARQGIVERLGPAALDVAVSSAGVRAWPDQPMHPHAAQVLRERGADAAGFASRQLSAELVAGADLVLTASRRQRAWCAELVPQAVRRVFTLLQFGRLAAGVDPVPAPAGAGAGVRLAALLDAFPAARAGQPVTPGEQDDLFDPVGLPVPEFRRCADLIAQVVEVMTDRISPR